MKLHSCSVPHLTAPVKESNKRRTSSSLLCDTIMETDTGTQYWTLTESPFIIIHDDLIINPKAKLVIDPGVRILIGAGLSIKVKGVIHAKGTSDRRIVFTKWSASDKHNSPLGNYVNETMILPRINTFTDQPYHKIRLVNGKCINQGELQIWLASKWRSVCSQNNEWSKIDSRIACQQLGYFNGNFSLGSQSFNRYPSVQIIKPNCFGNETNELGLFSCPGLMKNISYGRNICGVNRSNYHSAALSSTPYPPVLCNVHLAYNAHHAINFKRIRGPAILENVTVCFGYRIQNNYGHGVKITSIMGYIRLNSVTSLRNNGDGLNIKLLSGPHYHWPEETLEFIHKAYWVCRPGSIPASPVFPFLMIAELPGPTFKTSGMCEFHVASDQTDQIITINLLETIHDPIAYGRIEIWDKFTMNRIANWLLVNQTILNNHNNHTNYPSLVFHRNSGPLKGLVYQGVSSDRNAILIKFFWNKLTDRFVCSEFANCIRALLHISVGQISPYLFLFLIVSKYVVMKTNKKQSKVIYVTDKRQLNFQIILKNSIISGNSQHGLSLYNPWAYIHLENNTFEQNQYEAGVKILGGSFIRNQNAGLNISVNGGFKQINNSLFHNNYGHGLVIWNLNQSDLSSLRQPNLPLKTHVHLSNFTGYSYFNKNQLNAIIISPMINIIGKIINSTFIQHLHGVIYMDTSTTNHLFQSQQLREYPIDYTLKTNHAKVLWICDETDRYITNLRILSGKSVQIKSSSLLKPRSTCPAVIVIGSSNVHIFRNHLWNPYSDIELASHLSSPDKQINATLNYWGNLQDWSTNDWSIVHKIVSNKIFDQNHRYTLAKINYHPLLKDLNLRSNFITSNEPPYISNFIQTTTSINEPVYLGGRIPIEQSREVILKPMQNPKSFYRVTKDIFIPPTGRLIIQPAVKLFFDSGVGLFSQGELKLEGTLMSPIIFDHYSQVRLNSDELQGHFINHANLNKSIPNNTVRLSGGEWSTNNNSYYGRLEVWISRINQISSSEYGYWAIVCEDGFNEHALMLACLNIGLVANSKSWLPPVSIRKATIEKANRLMNRSRSSSDHITYIDCQGFETDLSECEYNYEPIAYPLQTCMNSMDLVIQCHRPGWSGIRITASDSGSRTIISHVQIHHAGLLDYTRLEYMPSLQLDYFSGTINNLKITNSLSDGLVILYSNPLLGIKIINSQFTDNFESGLLTYTPWFSLINCQITKSQINAGLQYNRIMTVEQRFAFHAGIVPTLTLFHNIEENSNRMTTTHTIYRTELSINDEYHLHQIIIDLLEFPGSVKLPTSQQQAVNYPKACIGPSITLNNSILPAIHYNKNNCNRLNNLHCMNTTTITKEELIIYDSGFVNFNPIQVYNWRIPKDLIRFPLISSTNKLIMELRVDGLKSGQFLFSIQVRNLHSQHTIATYGKRSHYDHLNVHYSLKPKFYVENTRLENNLIGVKLYHYNDPMDRQNNHFWRNEHETFIFENVQIR
ncbi:LOW QUALITY PROTEIN: scavenger receptor-related [Schistosoma mansoni]|uniref:scavenger receptor-related n=1 Tax=Schistosoma mansoni TaxID=6183 RepID=UPI00022DC95D|nr:LOW QUALITY PROTEIN: scavenger receptor-related [Schistosoma mansoni]|eukprot:XP_018647643.1 LOW QUALITY PROTEIN: scavenger receptor-related [Schistosoma mansoni]